VPVITATVTADRQVPALILKVGKYPLHSGGVAAIRTLGRLGIPVYAITEDRLTPAAVSRYCTGRFVWQATGLEDPVVLTAQLREIGRRLGKRSVIVPMDDEAAVLIAEYAAELSEYFLFPPVDPSLPRALASKQKLYEMCRRHGIPAPVTSCPATGSELAAFAASATFPVVVKNAEPWVRRRAPVVSHSAVLHSADELLAITPAKDEAPNVIVQEYIPREHAEDWFVHLYCDDGSNCLLTFTGLKVRSWPPHTGATASAYAVPNDVLANLAERLCKEIGFQGIADLDWRLDKRDGQYKLVDFNPRVGNQFRLFETAEGVDVVRALHLDLTGRPVPASPQLGGRRIVVEHIDLPARLSYRGNRGYPSAAPVPRHTSTELAWLAQDDPLPFIAMWPRLSKPLAEALTQFRRDRSRRGQSHSTGKDRMQ
jgi:predicted ATP-grasp superfamily ATP-dependent carboligase